MPDQSSLPTLTPAHVRAMLLAAQGLDCVPPQPPTAAGVLEIIRQMGVLQIDTIHVIARSPYLVLWSRLGNYTPRILEELLAQQQIFEYWAHAACFLPIESYPLYRSIMLSDEPGRFVQWARRWVEQNNDSANAILNHIREHGEVRSADFARTDGQTGGWWNWKTEKLALEAWFALGELVISRRERFHRIYDLRERILPDWNDSRTLSLEAVYEELTLHAVRALGVTKMRWVADYYRTDRRSTDKRVKALAAAGKLHIVEVEGWNEPGYVHPDHVPLVMQAAENQLIPQRTVLLSPFDPITWDRKRALELFNFDYLLESYTPAPKRVYGYFTLPILHKGHLIGRLDPKAHRSGGIFEIRNLVFERGVICTDELINDLADTIRACAEWHGTPRVAFQRSEPSDAAEMLQAALDYRITVES